MKRVLQLFTKKQTTVGSAAAVLATMVLTSRLLGLIRDRLLNARFTTEQLGPYWAAFRIPNLVFELLVMGALTSAFVPVFTKYLSRHKEKEAWQIASTLVNVSIIALALVSIPLFWGAESIARWLVPGFSREQVVVVASFTRFMLVFQVVPLLIGNFFTGILQSYNLFLVPALAPVLYNVGTILAILFFSQTIGLWAPVLGVGVGALLFMFVQIPVLLRLGFRHSVKMQLGLAGVKEVGRLMAPRTFGLAVSQIDATVDLMLASLLGASMVTNFHLAQHLQQLPVGLFGVTVAQAALPLLSQYHSREDMDQFKRILQRSIHQVLFFVLPASALFIVLRIPVVRLVFGADRFGWTDTVTTALTLSAFSISLFAQAIVQLLARGFYALYDSKTPVAIGMIAIITNTLVSIWFIKVLGYPLWSLGLSTSLASILNAGLLLWFLDKRVEGFSRRELFGPAVKMAVAALATGIALYVPLKLFDQLVFDTTRTFGLLLLTGVSAGAGLATYFFLCWFMGVGEVKFFFRLLRRVGRLRVLFEPAGEVVNGGMQDKMT